MSAPGKSRGAKAEQTTHAPGAFPSTRGSALQATATKPARSPLRPPQGNGGYRSKARRAPEGKTPPRYRTDSSRERILRSALKAAEERGYEALRIADITDPVGVQRQAFYAHFRDKRHCLAELLSPKLGAIERMAASASTQELDWAAQIMSAIDEILYERFHSAEGTRGRLISALRELLSEKGSLAAVRIGELVKAAHVPQADFYKNFAGKRECFACLYELLLAEVEHGLRERVDNRSDSGEDLTTLLGSLAEVLLEDPERLQLLVLGISELPASASPERTGALQGSLATRLARLIGECEGVAEGRAELLAGSTVELLRSALSRAELDLLGERLEALGGTFAEASLREAGGGRSARLAA